MFSSYRFVSFLTFIIQSFAHNKNEINEKASYQDLNNKQTKILRVKSEKKQFK